MERILVIDDDAGILDSVSKVLKYSGYEVEVAHDGEECIQKFNDAFLKLEPELLESGPFDVILIDNNMPKKSGAEAAKEILEKCCPDQPGESR